MSLHDLLIPIGYLNHTASTKRPPKSDEKIYKTGNPKLAIQPPPSCDKNDGFQPLSTWATPRMAQHPPQPLQSRPRRAPSAPRPRGPGAPNAVPAPHGPRRYPSTPHRCPSSATVVAPVVIWDEGHCVVGKKSSSTCKFRKKTGL